MTDGLSQKQRIQRLDVIDTFAPLDNRMETLLRQIEEIAGYIRYYSLNNKPDGAFAQLLTDIKKIRASGGIPDYNEDMEPSQALLYTFAHQLYKLMQPFNEGWTHRYISWYLNSILGVNPRPRIQDFTWLQLKTNNRNVDISKGTGFTCSEVMADEKIYYRAAENIQVNNIQVANVIALHLQKSKDIYPANLFGCPTALVKKDITTHTFQHRLFGQSTSRENIQSIGLQITSPSLVLSEGKRKVTLTFYSENNKWCNFTKRRMVVSLMRLQMQQGNSRKEAKENILIKLFNDIFYLKISTPSGWTTINAYAVSYGISYLSIQLQLDESFPCVTACNSSAHGTASKYPALKVLLNNDAWLYPYVWLKDFYINKVAITTHVEGLTDIVFYNELGEVDTSKPFSLFGINTEQNAWFVIGCYEMAIKSTRYADIKFLWHQLPKNERGLYDYYYEYDNDIDNRSFKIRSRYLSDYKWYNTGNEAFHLFSTIVKDKSNAPEAYGRLSDESILRNINLKDISSINVDKEAYGYDIRSKNGFLSFVLEEPEMGFGEKFYRQLYSRLLMTKAFRKKGSELNQPLNPLVDRTTLSYEACDEIDLLSCSNSQHTQLLHIHPLGEKRVYPQAGSNSIPFIHSIDTDASILFGLDNVKGEEQLNLYVEMLAQEEEISLFMLPEVNWFWGDSHSWERLPNEAIISNTTHNFLTSGVLKIYIPKIPDRGFKDENGLLWLRAGISKNQHSIAPIGKLYTNVAKVYRDPSQLDMKRTEGFVLDESETKLPGITGIIQIIPFSDEQSVEDKKRKLLRVSEFVSHRNRAITARDYERMTLQAFPEIRKVKCFFDAAVNKVCLAVIPEYIEGKDYSLPTAAPELLLRVEDFFNSHTSAFNTVVDAIHPIYEKITIRCNVTLSWTNYSEAGSRAVLTRVVNHLIAPWRRQNDSPVFGYSFTVQDIYNRIKSLKQVVEVNQLSILHISQAKDGNFIVKEYIKADETVSPSLPHAILIPASEHLFVSDQKRFGINEQEVGKNFVIWQNATEKR